MTDPLAEIVMLLRPQPVRSKMIVGRGSWRFVRLEPGRAFYCALLDGACLIATDGGAPHRLQAGSFALIPSTRNLEMASDPAGNSNEIDIAPVLTAPGELRIGTAEGDPDVQMVIGHCAFGSSDSEMLTALLPAFVHLQGSERLSTLVRMLWDEWRSNLPARDVILQRLLEVLLIEALRHGGNTASQPGLVRGLADPQLARVLRRMHEEPAAPWNVERLAAVAGQSRSVFCDRFKRALGVAPMRYLLDWRMTLAKDLLMRGKAGVSEVAKRVGYSSASTFSVAFGRQVGAPPATFARWNLAR